MQRFVRNSIFPILLAAAVLIFCRFKADAQSTVYSRVLYKVGGSASGPAQGIALDSNTNIYVLGTFASTTVINGTTLTNTTGWPDLFLVKFKVWPPRSPMVQSTGDGLRGRQCEGRM